MSDPSSDEASDNANKRRKNNPPESSAAAAKRRRDDNELGPRYVPVARKKYGAKKEPLASLRMKKKDVPPGAETLKEAYYEVIGYMWALDSGTTVPTLPPADVIVEFDTRFSEQGATTPRNPPPLSLSQKNFIEAITALRMAPHVNRKAANYLLLEDSVREYIIEGCQRYGLSAWRPDFRASPNTPYNNTHRMVAEEVFVQLATSYAFAHKGVSLAHIKDKRFLRKCYNHYVFHYQRSRYKRNLLGADTVQNDKAKQAVFQRRKRNRDRLWNYLVDHRVPHRFLHAIDDVCAHSDDEEVEVALPDIPNTKKTILRIKIKNLRSARFTRWIAQLRIDCERHQQYIKGKPRRGAFDKYERERTEFASETTLLKLPTSTTLDYFDPEVFNALPVSIRRLWAKNPRVAFPKDDAHMFSDPPHESMTMSDREFKQKYAAEVLAQYNIPQEDEVDSEEYAWSDEDD